MAKRKAEEGGPLDGLSDDEIAEVEAALAERRRGDTSGLADGDVVILRGGAADRLLGALTSAPDAGAGEEEEEEEGGRARGLRSYFGGRGMGDTAG